MRPGLHTWIVPGERGKIPIFLVLLIKKEKT